MDPLDSTTFHLMADRGEWKCALIQSGVPSPRMDGGSMMPAWPADSLGTLQTVSLRKGEEEKGGVGEEKDEREGGGKEGA